MTTTQKKKKITVPAPNFEIRKFDIVGTTQFVQHRFDKKSEEEMRAKQVEGTKAANKKTAKPPKDFTAAYEGCFYRPVDGGYGIPAGAFRAAMVRAAKLVGINMTDARVCVFIEADTTDAVDGTPLVKITKGEPERFEKPVRLPKGGSDIRIRPHWPPGWEATVTVNYDADFFNEKDIANLLLRAGFQVGVGDGRPSSPNSCGMDWGKFTFKDNGRK